MNEEIQWEKSSNKVPLLLFPWPFEESLFFDR